LEKKVEELLYGPPYNLHKNSMCKSRFRPRMRKKEKKGTEGTKEKRRFKVERKGISAILEHHGTHQLLNWKEEV